MLEPAMRPAGWLRGLDRSATVSGIVPSGFESYLRILHKAHPAETDISGPVPTASWREVAAALGRPVTSATRWAELSGAYGEAASVPGLGTVYPPEEGRLDAPGFNAMARVLAGHTDGTLLAAFWTGWEPLRGDSEAARRKRVTVRIQGEQYLLYSFLNAEVASGSWMEASAFGWSAGNGLTPNYLWPSDGSWCLGTGIDLDSTVLGGPEPILSEVEALPELEALRVEPATDLTSSIRTGR